MKGVKQIREKYNLIIEKDESDTRKLTTLVRSGLFDAKKLPLLKRALEKNADKLTPAERKVMMELLDSLMSEVLHSQQVYSKVKQNVHGKEEMSEAVKGFDNYLSKFDTRVDKGYSEKDMPSVIILKRKAIRVYPDNQKVALYYSDALDKYVTIPFGGVGINEARKYEYSDEDESTNDPYVVTKKYKSYDPKDFKQKQQISDTMKKYKENLASGKYTSTKAMTRVQQNLKGHEEALGKIEAKAKTKRKQFDLSRQDVGSLEQPDYKKLQRAISRDTGLTGIERLGLKLGTSIRRKFTGGKSSAGVPTQTKVTESYESKFRKKLDEKRNLKEISAEDAAELAKDVFIPGHSAYKEYKKGNYGTAALEAGIDVASLAAGAVTGGLGYGAIKAARGASKAAKAAKAAKTTEKAADTATTVKSAEKVADVTSKATKVGKVSRAGKIAKRSAIAAGAIAGALSAGKSADGTKYSTPLAFKGVDPKVSKPKSGFRTSVDARDTSLYRKSLQQPTMQESNVIDILKQVSEGNGINRNVINIGESSVTINRTIANKMINLYETLNDSNKKKMKTMLNEDVESFKKILDFAVRQ